LSDKKNVKKQEASVEETTLIAEEELGKVTGGGAFDDFPRVPFHDYEADANKNTDGK
jgi:hypothetical protein